MVFLVALCYPLLSCCHRRLPRAEASEASSKATGSPHVAENPKASREKSRHNETRGKRTSAYVRHKTQRIVRLRTGTRRRPGPAVAIATTTHAHTIGWLLLRLAISSLSRPRARCPLRGVIVHLPFSPVVTSGGHGVLLQRPVAGLYKQSPVVRVRPCGGLGVAWALIFACNGTSAASPVTRPSQPRVSVVCDRDGCRPANVELVHRLPQNVL